MNFNRLKFTLIGAAVTALLMWGVYALYVQFSTIDSSKMVLQAENIRFPKQISDSEILFFSGYNFHTYNFEKGTITDLSSPLFFPKIEQLTYSQDNSTVIFRAISYEDDDILNKLLPATDEFSPIDRADWWSYSINQKKPTLLQCKSGEVIDKAYIDNNTIYLLCRKGDTVVIETTAQEVRFSALQTYDSLIGIRDSIPWILRKAGESKQIGYLKPDSTFVKLDDLAVSAVISQANATVVYQTGSAGEDQDEPVKLKKISTKTKDVSTISDSYIGGLQDDLPVTSQVFLNAEIKDNTQENLAAIELRGDNIRTLKFNKLKLQEYTQWYRLVIQGKDVYAAIDTSHNLWLINPPTGLKPTLGLSYSEVDAKAFTKSVVLNGPDNTITASMVGTDFNASYEEFKSMISTKNKDIRTTRLEFFSNPQSISTGERILNYEY